jgi:hypothetical protein
MTGYPEHNFPAFREAAAAWRAAGHTVVSPSEQEWNDDLGQPWEFYLRRDIPLLLQCDGVVLLPGWERSRGARLEAHIADALGMQIFQQV